MKDFKARLLFLLKPTWAKGILLLVLIAISEFGTIQGAIIGDIMQIDPKAAANPLYQMLSRQPYYPHFWELSVVLIAPVLPFAWVISWIPIVNVAHEWLTRVIIYPYLYLLSSIIVASLTRWQSNKWLKPTPPSGGAA